MTNRMPIVILAATFVAAAWISARHVGPTLAECDYIETLRIDRAEADANDEIASGDDRLLAIYSYSYAFREVTD